MPARLFLFRLLLSCAGLALAGAGHAQDSPVARWTFDEALDGEALDVAGQRRDGVTGRSRRVAGVAGSALVFDGYTTALVRPAGFAPTLTDGFTITAWLAVAAYPWNSVPIVSHGDGRLRGYSFDVGPRGALEFSAAVDGRRLEAGSADFALPLRQWIHVAARFDPADGLAVYVDGERAASVPLPERTAGYGRTPTRRVQPAAGLDLVVGAVRAPRRAASYHRLAGTRPSWYSLDGLLDEVRIYDAALPLDAIAAAARAQRPDAPALAVRRLPSGPPGAGRFGAYPAKLAYYPEWDAQWRVGPHPDLLLRFDASPARVVFWRGTQYSPAWVSGNGLWMADQSVEGYDDDFTWEHMNDKQNRYSHVRVIEQHDARVVVHWRYAPVNVNDELMNVTERAGNGAWIDEYYTFHPDVTGVRRVSWTRGSLAGSVQFQESIPLAHPGQTQGEVVHDEYVTVGNLAGETQRFAYVADPGEASRPVPDELTIQMHHLRSREQPFIVFEPGNRMTYLRDLDARSLSRPGSSSHWPVGLQWSDGRTAQALDRATSFLGFPISEPVLHAGDDGRDYWQALYGMTQEPFAELVMLARSWSRPPEAVLQSAGFLLEGYDRGERCYRLRRGADADVLDLTFTATEESPLVNIPLVIEDWGDAGALLELDGRDVARGPGFRYGHRRRLDGTDLVVWMAHEAQRTTRVVLRRDRQGR